MQVEGNVGISLFCDSALLFPKPKHRVFSSEAEPEGTVLTVIWQRYALAAGPGNYPCYILVLENPTQANSLFLNFINIHFTRRNVSKSNYVILVSDKGQGMSRVHFPNPKVSTLSSVGMTFHDSSLPFMLGYMVGS